jgi:hypothetical protein
MNVNDSIQKLMNLIDVEGDGMSKEQNKEMLVAIREHCTNLIDCIDEDEVD